MKPWNGQHHGDILESIRILDLLDLVGPEAAGSPREEPATGRETRLDRSIALERMITEASLTLDAKLTDALPGPDPFPGPLACPEFVDRAVGLRARRRVSRNRSMTFRLPARATFSALVGDRGRDRVIFLRLSTSVFSGRPFSVLRSLLVYFLPCLWLPRRDGVKTRCRGRVRGQSRRSAPDRLDVVCRSPAHISYLLPGLVAFSSLSSIP